MMLRFWILLLTITWILHSQSMAAKKEKDSDNESEESTQTDDSILKSYLDVGLIIVPVVKGDDVVAFARVKIQVVTTDNTTIDPYHKYKKILLDAYFSDLYHVLCDHWLDSGKDPSQESIKKRLSQVTDKIVGPNKLKTYITNYYFHRPEKKKLPLPTH